MTMDNEDSPPGGDKVLPPKLASEPHDDYGEPSYSQHTPRQFNQKQNNQSNYEVRQIHRHLTNAGSSNTSNMTAGLPIHDELRRKMLIPGDGAANMMSNTFSSVGSGIVIGAGGEGEPL